MEEQDIIERTEKVTKTLLVLHGKTQVQLLRYIVNFLELPYYPIVWDISFEHAEVGPHQWKATIAIEDASDGTEHSAVGD